MKLFHKKYFSNRSKDWHNLACHSPSDHSPTLASFSVSQLLNGDSYSSGRLESGCILTPEFIISQSNKYLLNNKYSLPVKKYLNPSPCYASEETEELASSPIFVKTEEEENKSTIVTSASHNNATAVNIADLTSSENLNERRRIERIAVEAQIEIDQFSYKADRPKEVPFLQDAKTNPSEINFDSILADNVSYRSDTSQSQSYSQSHRQNISLSISGCPELSDASLLNRILSSGKHLFFSVSFFCLLKIKEGLCYNIFLEFDSNFWDGEKDRLLLQNPKQLPVYLHQIDFLSLMNPANVYQSMIWKMLIELCYDHTKTSIKTIKVTIISYPSLIRRKWRILLVMSFN